MNFSDIANAVLQRLHQQGVNWGGSPQNAPASLVPPYWLALEINQTYGRALALVKDYPACVPPLTISTPTVASSNTLSLNPVPANGGTANPAVLNVYEFAYIQNAGQTRYIPFVSTATYRKFTGGYSQVQGSYSAFPDVLCQQFAQRAISMFPGTATAGDAIQLRVCPDPIGTGTLCAASAGGLLVNASDVPLLEPQFHQLLVEGTVLSMSRTLDKSEIAVEAKGHWDELVQEAIDFGSAWAEGDAEQQVVDTWFTAFDSQVSIFGG